MQFLYRDGRDISWEILKILVPLMNVLLVRKWVQTRHKEKECEVVIGAGYFAAVNCCNETVQCTCRHEKELFSRELILWQALENLWDLRLPQQSFCRMKESSQTGKQLPTSEEFCCLRIQGQTSWRVTVSGCLTLKIWTVQSFHMPFDCLRVRTA
jgi:hypothetical protein